MTVWTFYFVARRRGISEGLCTALVLLTAFEIHRAGLNCRVDMVLTMLTVNAIYCFYDWWKKGMNGISWSATLMMSLATLTKGPVGMVVPCLAVGIFLLMQRVNFFKAFWKNRPFGTSVAHTAAAMVLGGLPAGRKGILRPGDRGKLRPHDKQHGL